MMPASEKIETLYALEKAKEKQMSEQLGLEADDMENDGSDEDSEAPYNADKIRIESKVFPIFQVKNWINKEQIMLKPEFQRNTVWDNKRKSLLIESLMLRIPIPAFYFDEDTRGAFAMIKSLGIQNYKCFVDQEIRFKNLSILV